jgi:hypothetical protein
MSDQDLGKVLDGWDHDESNIRARWITGIDGHPKIQLRVDLGVLQMEVKGRPDGTQPRGEASLLDYYRSVESRIEEEQGEMILDGPACSELQREALQYYYRYLAFYALRYLDGVIEDTSHNLDLLDMVARYAEDDGMAWQFLQFFPYVRMMNARARAEKLSEKEKFDHATDVLEEALEDVEAFCEEHGNDDGTGSQEVDILKDLLEQIAARKPKTPEELLQEELSLAIATENYEEAAVLRDQLQELTEAPRPAGDREAQT